MRTKIITCVAAAMLMSVMPFLFVIAEEKASHIIDYTSGDMMIPVTETAEPTLLPVSSDITIPDIISVYDAAHDVTFEIDTEEYIIGVVAAEMPSGFGVEALKAQAVAARSYMLYKMTYNPATHKGGASVCTDYKCCKAYLSYEDAVLRWTEETAKEVFDKIRTAIKPVRGVIMTYDDAVICALFHASSSGMTESAVNVWGGDLSYLHSVDTPENEDPVIKEFTSDEFVSRLNKAGYHISATDNIDVTLNDTGRVDYITAGDISAPGAEIRNILGLRSTLFSVEQNESMYVFTCYGYGHGVGMSQYGADALANQGYTYDEILRHYYKGISLYTGLKANSNIRQ